MDLSWGPSCLGLSINYVEREDLVSHLIKLETTLPIVCPFGLRLYAIALASEDGFAGLIRHLIYWMQIELPGHPR